MRDLPGFSLWIGHAGDARDLAALHDAGILAVVDLASNEPPVLPRRDLVYGRFPLIDGVGNPRWLLRGAVEMVANLLRGEVPTLVACGAGLSRSPCIAGAAIARVRGCSPAEGLRLAIGSGRSDVSPGLWAAVLEALG